MARSHSRREAVARPQHAGVAGGNPGAGARTDPGCATPSEFAARPRGTRPLFRDRPRKFRAAEARSAQDRSTPRSARTDPARSTSGTCRFYRSIARCWTALRTRHHRTGARPERAGGAQGLGSAVAGRTGAAAACPRDCTGPTSPWGSRRDLPAAAAAPVRRRDGAGVSRNSGKNPAAFLLQALPGAVKRQRRFRNQECPWPTTAISFPSSTG
jgi:hypothetical protein